jgi:hypothetical protein
MTQMEILAEFKKLTALERLQVIQSALRLLGEDLQLQRSPALTERKQQLVQAAKALLPDYAVGNELTIFTHLDGEEFYAQG